MILLYLSEAQKKSLEKNDLCHMVLSKEDFGWYLNLRVRDLKTGPLSFLTY